jgi:DNA-binding NarL/FixJ family response regulator
MASRSGDEERESRQGAGSRSARPVRVLVIERNPLARRAIRELLEREADLETVGDAADASEAARLAATHEPDVVIVDSLVRFEAVAAEMRAASPRAAIVVLSLHADTLSTRSTLRAGARGGAQREDAAENLASAIRRVASGIRYDT